MKKTIIIIILLCMCTMPGSSQEANKKNSASFNLGSGLNFSLNNGNYQFNFGGFVQPAFRSVKIKGMNSENEFSSKRSYFMLSGKAVKEKISFLVQTDYSLSNPLLDAWVAYHPLNDLTITFGQKQTFVNNREMTYREDRLQFTDRSFLSQNFSNTGREFGLFIESKFKIPGHIGLAPMLAVTSGDGRNSFGSDSRDVDLGGFKVGGRLDVYPLGFFREGNELYSADLMHEEALKFVLGSALSKNYGASSSVGEGHGDFFLYNNQGNINLPDYTQLYFDLLLKYSGFSFLAEYVNASASNLEEVYLDQTSTSILAPEQISEFLFLGDSFNIQTGYVTNNGWSFDFRYESLMPEFETNTNSLLSEANSFSFGVSKYFIGNNLKIQTAYTSLKPELGSSQNGIEFLVQVVF